MVKDLRDVTIGTLGRGIGCNLGMTSHSLESSVHKDLSPGMLVIGEHREWEERQARVRKRKKQIHTYRFLTNDVVHHLSICCETFRNPTDFKNHFPHIGRAIFIS